ncbi:Ger(x)C family spore germination protein [Paenibacillus allorhizosphaerae]|uniref:Spore germination protein B3 n=1 Tax=Paenibacillus allorhizosphaerae TaxID=2849866 RepID=A0ABM8VJN4_9BACL|nr:Ger(x)C family spore germination protein [Paenibacillus allorhizosphaerae]CAG7645760.1 Spore germination protein B3 [Paenibacillus allorhizosphaerae]
MTPATITTKLKFLLLIPYACSVLLLTGCWDRTEVNDLAIIMAAGLDKKTEKTVELSVQVFVPKSSKTGGEELASASSAGGTGQTLVRAAEGYTLADAISKLQEKLPRIIFWGHAEIFIFGEQIAKEGLSEHIDFLARAPGPRERANLFISKGTAKNILRLLPPLERSSAEVLRELAKAQTGLSVTIKDYAQMMIGGSDASVLPWIDIVPPEPEAPPLQSIGFINGSAILKQNRMVGWIDDRLTRGLLWLRNEVKTATVTIEPKEAEGRVSLSLLRARTELVPRIENGVWSMTVKIYTEDDIIQNTTILDLSDPKLSHSMERQLAEAIEARIRAVLVKPQKQWNADIFDFAEAFRRAYPKEWKRAKTQWDDIFPHVTVHIESKVKILRTGLSSSGVINLEREKMNK